MNKVRLLVLTAALSLGLAAACFVDGSSLPQPEPEPGQSDFVSADAQAGQQSLDNRGECEGGLCGTPGNEFDDGASGQSERTVEEGDIYRVLGGGLIVNFNAYRGLQVIDFSDVTRPEIVGRLRVSGTPVEMYVVGNFAYLLLNNWQGYYVSTRSSIGVDSYYGGVVMAVDIADPENPRLTDQARVPGWILTSRLTRGGGRAALYVAANDWSADTSRTVVRSFALVGGNLEQRTTIDLGGYVQDIQATTEALLVARYDWTGGRTNHLETFLVTDIQNPQPVDHKLFGTGESLYATLFLDNRAFFVTYRRVDPFHAFYIDDQGHAQQRSEFIVSGWNDFFRPALGATRLVGIGVNDESGRTMAVSLYDITDLENPQPLLARAEVSADSSWSEAQWDDKAFSVLENAVAVRAPDGTLETGLVLLPFSGYSDTEQRYLVAVQVFTFSDHTLTRRGLMLQDTWVRRSFLADDELAANLSDLDLTLFDLRDPDQPEKLAELELAPNYQGLFDFGSHAGRLRSDGGYYWWWGDGSQPPPNRLEMVGYDQDLDLARPEAEIDLPADAQLERLGNLLVSIRYEWIQDDQDGSGHYRTHLEAIDMSDPLHPRRRGQLVSDELEPGWNYGYYYPYYPDGGIAEDCAFGDCRSPGYYYGGGSGLQVVGSALVFPSPQWEQQFEGIEHVCYTYPAEYWNDCRPDDQGGQRCTYPSGQVTCRSLNGAPATCTGFISICSYDSNGSTSCRAAAPYEVRTETHCYDYDRYRYWYHYRLQVVDFADPDNPVLAAVLERPQEEEDVSLLADGSDLWLSFKSPTHVAGDSRPYVRYYVKRIDLGNPAQPVLGPSINVPGVLQRVAGDIIFTNDTVWGEDIVETAINKLRLNGHRAVLLARERFRDEEVHAVVLDDGGRLLVTHRPAWTVIQRQGLDWNEVMEQLSIYDVGGDDFRLLGEIEIDTWATLRDARAGRALFAVPGGLLVVNIADAGNPFAQAWFPVQGWPQSLLVHGDEVIFAAGPWGVFRFNMNTYNLLPGD